MSKIDARSQKWLPGFLLAVVFRIVQILRAIQNFLELLMLQDDVVAGAKRIAPIVGMTERQTYHHAQAGRLPVWKVGQTLFARRSVLLAWLREREEAASRLSWLGSDRPRTDHAA
ncbi:hypothetical protein [Lichenifustis flavocetrariae]|uniref:Helix-turn-helix domain-containing protein n=1 Tax=Lichenifustis flavocetrariae TaxID=2949735 RepID=A0AA41Z4Y6_9HYPH|nr:hypothetical protein [Lichenifustis flavocetrariae]MCW6513106.1 hypothetical protein [Lichenifustis flavocetrariae]